MRKINKKNLNKAIICFVLFVIIALIIINIFSKEKDYEIEYEVNNIKVTESLNYKSNIYSFKLSIDNEQTSFSIIGNNENKKLISTIKKIDENCIEIKGQLNFYDICYEDNVNYYYFKEDNTEKKQTKNDIAIYNWPSKNIILWDYNGYIHINNDKINKEKLFSKDIYFPESIINLGSQLYIPNYEQEITYNEYYLINIKLGDNTKYSVNKDLKYDLKFVGYEDDILKLYDNINNQQLEINLYRETLKTKSGIKYTNKDLENFNKSKNQLYIMEDNYIKYRIGNDEIILKYEADRIIYQNSELVIFLKDNYLYEFSHVNGLTKILTNTNWEFDEQQIVYIY